MSADEFNLYSVSRDYTYIITLYRPGAKMFWIITQHDHTQEKFAYIKSVCATARKTVV